MMQSDQINQISVFLLRADDLKAVASVDRSDGREKFSFAEFLIFEGNAPNCTIFAKTQRSLQQWKII